MICKEKDETVEVIRRFNWKFWKPIDCIGGKVYWGFYYPRADGSGMPQTRLQFFIKRRMGICRLVER